MHCIIRSGVPLLDDWLTGVRDGGIHLLTGGPGCGKSTIALHFADAALRGGESVAMLVRSRADDIRAHARFLGIDFTAALRNESLILLRYRSNFAHEAAHAVSPEQVVADLDRLVAPVRPTRIVIDTMSPFVSGPPPVAPFVTALAEWLGRAGRTSLVTFPEELSSGYDRSLEPLVHDAAAIIRLTREDANVRRAELLSLRYAPPETPVRRFVVRAGVGIVAEHSVRLERLTLQRQ